MRDGVRVAVDLTLPAGLSEGEKIPGLIVQTRYWRANELRLPFKWLIKPQKMTPRPRDLRFFFGSRGYALVNMDVRGTGASFGSLRFPWAPETVEDAREVVDWMIRQPWCSGKVGGFGTSYPGTAAEFLAVLQHPAIKIVVPRFNHPDPYLDIAFPGGLFNERFVKFWGLMDETLDRNVTPPGFGFLMKLMQRGVKPVDGKDGRKLLKTAVREHRSNGEVYSLARLVTFRDDVLPEGQISVDGMSVHRAIKELHQSPTAMHGWASWLDAGTGDAVIRRFLTLPNARRAVIGAWDHGGNRHASPFTAPETPTSPSIPEQLGEMLRIFDAYLKDADNGVRTEHALVYFTMGEEKWKKTPVWPPEGMVPRSLYLAAGGALADSAPQVGDASDSYQVDFNSSSGKSNRWWEMGILEKKTVIYPDRSALDGNILSYITPPLERDTEISGHPVLTLYASSTEPDTAFFIYLEDVGEDGRVTYLTEGLLRSIHRNVSAERPNYNIPIPHHTFRKQDANPLVPGEVACLEIGLFATSALVRRGHRIRLSLAGHDSDTFSRVPRGGNPTIVVAHDPAHPSHITLPVIDR